MTPQLKYYKKGREVVIDKKDLEIVDSLVNKRARFGFVTGPGASGKT
jgi:hypothetical protein